MTSNTLKFVWENKIHSISNIDPNETILNYVRIKLKKTGTKEIKCKMLRNVTGSFKNCGSFFFAWVIHDHKVIW